MNNSENISVKPSRAIWFWCAGFLTLMLLLVALAMPLVLNFRAIKHVESFGGEVVTELNPKFEALPKSWKKWLRSSLGDRIQSIETVKYIYWDDSSIKDDDLRCLERFTNLSRLYIGSTQISDAGLSHLKGLTNLKLLYLHNTQITDEGLSHLKGLTKLESLTISSTQISDAGLNYLKGHTNLKYLAISSTQISDAGLSHLKVLINLDILSISNTQISKEGVSQLQTALPNCLIHSSVSP